MWFKEAMAGAGTEQCVQHSSAAGMLIFTKATYKIVRDEMASILQMFGCRLSRCNLLYSIYLKLIPGCI